jgi:hypothetical protein
MTLKCKSLAALMVAGITSQMALADGKGFEMENNFQYAYALNSSEDKALGYGADSKKLETFRFQHESSYSLGSNFFLYDQLKSDKPLGGPVFGPNNPAAYAYGDGNSTYFMVAGTELHSSKVLGTQLGTGLYKDWGLSGRIERGGYYDYRAVEYGPQVHLNVPGFDVFKITAWQRSKSDISGSAGQTGYDVGTRRDYRDSWLIGMDWKTKFNWLGKTWTSQAFVRYQVGDGGKADAKGTENINGIPTRLWVEPDLFMQVTDKVDIGIRDYYLRQSDAINNGYSTVGKKSHHVPQIALRVRL